MITDLEEQQRPKWEDRAEDEEEGEDEVSLPKRGGDGIRQGPRGWSWWWWCGVVVRMCAATARSSSPPQHLMSMLLRSAAGTDLVAWVWHAEAADACCGCRGI